MNAALKDLSRLLGGACATEDDARLARARDCWPQCLAWPPERVLARLPLAVALPESEGQVSRVLAWAGRQGVPIVPRGGGSSVVGAAIPGPAGTVVLDMSRLRPAPKMEEDAEGPRVTAGAGTLGGELEARLNARGLSLLHFPASLDVSTVGGWVATRSFGQLSTRYGGIERQALSARLAYPGGEIVPEPPGLHIGAEGSLGVITEVTLRARRAPRGREGLGLSFRGMDEALAYVRALWDSPLPRPSVLRLYGPADALLSLRGSGGGLAGMRERLEPFAMRHFRWIGRLARWLARSWVVVLIYEDDAGALEAARALPGCRPARVSVEPAVHWWARRYHWSLERLKRVFERGCFADTMDLWGRWEELGSIERAVARAIEPHAFSMSHLSHFDSRGACLYVTFTGGGASPALAAERHAAAWRAGLEACVARGGRVNHHHGVGLAKLPWLEHAVDPLWHRELKLAKLARDPQGLLNPGKLGL